MRMKFIEASKVYKAYQLGNYRFWVIRDNPTLWNLYRWHAISPYVPDIIQFNGELKIQQDVHWGAVTPEQARKIIAGYQEALDVIEFVTERFSK